MTVTITFMGQAGAGSTAPDAPSREQIREQIRQTVQGFRDLQAAQASQPVRSTVIRRNGKVVTITTDKSGNTTVSEEAGAQGAPSSIPAPPAVPGVTMQPPDIAFAGHPSDIPPEAVSMAYGLFAMCAVMVVGWPIARAFGRRIERKEAAPALPAATAEQLQRIEQAVEAMAIEVERISESQRFMARIQSGSSAERV